MPADGPRPRAYVFRPRDAAGVGDALDAHDLVVAERTGEEATGRVERHVSRPAAVVANLDHARRFINVLHGIGCQFALDDFGSGMGSFANLKHLSLDYLKIDGTYTRDLQHDSVNREMVAAMIKLAHSLDITVVAEQIDDQATFETVRSLGIDFIQGYIVERPRPLKTMH